MGYGFKYRCSFFYHPVEGRGPAFQGYPNPLVLGPGLRRGGMKAIGVEYHQYFLSTALTTPWMSGSWT